MVISGKWYVSKGGEVERNPPFTNEPYPGAHNCILSGPHETKGQAEDAKKRLRTEQPNDPEPYVWQPS